MMQQQIITAMATLALQAQQPILHLRRMPVAELLFWAQCLCPNKK